MKSTNNTFNLICRITSEEHRRLIELEKDDKATLQQLRKLGSLGIEGDFAVLVSTDQLHQTIVHGYVRLGAEQFGDLVLEESLDTFGLPPLAEAIPTMGEQHAARLQAAAAVGPQAMLSEFSRPKV